MALLPSFAWAQDSPTGKFDNGRYKTVHFTIDYSQVGRFVSNPLPSDLEYLQAVGQELEFIRGQYRSMGYECPPSQYVELRRIVYGGGAEVEGKADKLAQMFIGVYDMADKLIPLVRLRLTLAHEYFHRVQMQYYSVVAPAKFVREATASVMELLLYPGQAAQTIRENNDLAPAFIRESFMDSSYDAAPFYLYLAKRLQRNAIRELWEAYSSYTTFSEISAIESVVKAAGQKEKFPSLFYDFAEEFFTSNPPYQEWFPVFRENWKGNSVIEVFRMGAAKELRLRFDGMKYLTGRYDVVERSGSGPLKVKLEKGAPGLSIRLYKVEKERTGYLTSLKEGSEEALDLPAGVKLGVLATNIGSSTSTAQVHLQQGDQAQAAGGFQHGDSRFIDPRLAVSPDGKPCEEISSMLGGRLVIVAVQCMPGSYILGWSVTRRDSLEEARTDIQEKTVELKNVLADRRRGESIFQDRSRFAPDEAYLNYSRPGGYDQTGLSRFLIYRDVFIIYCHYASSRMEDFGPECEKFVEKSRDLIDLRFPPEGAAKSPVP